MSFTPKNLHWSEITWSAWKMANISVGILDVNAMLFSDSVFGDGPTSESGAVARGFSHSPLATNEIFPASTGYCTRITGILRSLSQRIDCCYFYKEVIAKRFTQTTRVVTVVNLPLTVLVHKVYNTFISISLISILCSATCPSSVSLAFRSSVHVFWLNRGTNKPFFTAALGSRHKSLFQTSKMKAEAILVPA